MTNVTFKNNYVFQKKICKWVTLYSVWIDILERVIYFYGEFETFYDKNMLLGYGILKIKIMEFYDNN